MRRARKNDIYTAKLRLAEVRALQVIPHELHHFGADESLMKEIADDGVRRWYPEYLGAARALKTALVSIEGEDQVFTEAINCQDWQLPDELLKRVTDALYKIEK